MKKLIAMSTSKKIIREVLLLVRSMIMSNIDQFNQQPSPRRDSLPLGHVCQ